MKSSLRKTARVAFVLLCACLCVLFAFACKEKASESVTMTFALEGEVRAGEYASVKISLEGSEEAKAAYEALRPVIRVLEGAEIASVEDGQILIAESAKMGDAFKLKIILNDLEAEQAFTVTGTSVKEVRLLCADSAEAGEEIPLLAEVLPANASRNTPTFVVVSGEGTVEGNVLRVSDTATEGRIVLQAELEGVKSREKRITVTTVQTTAVTLSLSADTALPGESVICVKGKEPAYSTYELILAIESGAEYAELDEASGVLRVREDAPLLSEIVIVARSGRCEARKTLRVDTPEVTAVTAQGGGSIAPGANGSFTYLLTPAAADPKKVRISLVEGEEYVEWTEGASFLVKTDAPQDAEITFLIEADQAYTTLSFTVEKRVLSSLVIETAGNTGYLKCGESLTFRHRAEPATYDGIVNYRAIVGADLVTISGETVTVKQGAGIGEVVIVAESADGIQSNPVEIAVSGRYSRRVYSSWNNVSLSASGENACVWMVLPSSQNAGAMTVIVPREVVDLVIQGGFDGTDGSAYKDLCFYFRNAPERSVTLWNFGTIATQGLGGTVMDFGSSGSTEIVLWGQNLVRADSPYTLDNSGEETDGVWATESKYSSYESLVLTRRAGKYGYHGSTGGTAISGYTLSFVGEGTLTAAAGSGTNGTPGGKGADPLYDETISTYLSGAGGDGGHGGDSGSAIYVYNVTFASGLVTALPGNAGVGAKGGSAGDLAALVGKGVVMISGEDGADGRDGVCYPAVRATKITGTNYTSSLGTVQSRAVTYEGDIIGLKDKLTRFYGVGLYYGTALYNPYAKLSKSKRYTMETQTDPVELMRQGQFLMYTLSVMPKNLWREISFRSGTQVTIYLCRKMTSGTGGNILGLTSETNNVWFATFNTEIRGCYQGGYYNIMLHEFTHVLHYKCSSTQRSAFESKLESHNYGLSYKSAYGSVERVYGVSASYDETNSCFLSTYSRKSVMEDAAETLSMGAIFLSLVPPMQAGTTIRKKYDLLVETFGREYETLSPFKTGKTLFAYPHLFE